MTLSSPGHGDPKIFRLAQCNPVAGAGGLPGWCGLQRRCAGHVRAAADRKVPSSEMSEDASLTERPEVGAGVTCFRFLAGVANMSAFSREAFACSALATCDVLSPWTQVGIPTEAGLPHAFGNDLP